MARLHLAALVLAATLGGCSGSGTTTTAASGPAAPPADTIGTELAKVAGLPVGSTAFNALAARQTPADGAAFSAEEKADILDRAVTDELLFQKAFGEGLYHDPKVRRILINLLLRNEIYAKVRNNDFTAAELEGYFEEHKEEFVIPEKLQVKRIFVEVKADRGSDAAKEIADHTFAQLTANPDSFRDLAIAVSDDPYKRRGGDLGYLAPEGKPGVPPEIVTKAFKTEVGTITEPFLAAGGWNIIQVANKRDRLERTFEQMKGSVLRRLKNERYETLTATYIEGLKGDSTVVVDEAALAALKVDTKARPSLGAPPNAQLGALSGGDEPSTLEAIEEQMEEDDAAP